MFTTQTTMSEETLERAFLRRIREGDDKAAAVFAQELLREAEGSAPCEVKDRIVAAGLASMRLLSHVPILGDFALTADVLWSAIIAGWLTTDDEHMSGQAEKDLARCIADGRLLLSETATRRKILARIREGIDGRRDSHAVYHKVVRFLQVVDVENDSPEIIRAMARSLGHLAPIQELVFVSHVLESLTEEAGYTPQTLRLAAPLAAEQVARIVAMALDVAVLTSELDETCEAIAGKVTSAITPATVCFRWELSIEEDQQKDEVFSRALTLINEFRSKGRGRYPIYLKLSYQGRTVRGLPVPCN